MRPDMHEVIIERPRHAHWASYPRARVQNRWRDEGPSREGMGARYGDKHLNENLAPLVRFLRSRVGRPWSKVRSEIAEHLRVSSAVQKHVMDHVKDFVAERVWRDADGRMWGADRYGRPRGIVPTTRPEFFVHPKTGLLAMAPIVSRKTKRRGPRNDPTVRALSAKRHLRRVGGAWFDVELAELPLVEVPPFGYRRGVPVWDVVARRTVTAWQLTWNDPEPMAVEWRAGRYAKSMRQLSKKEIRALLGA